MSSGCSKSDQIKGSSATNHNHIGVPAHGMPVQKFPNLFHQGPVILGGFPPSDKFRRADEIETIISGTKITGDAFHQIGIPVHDSFIHKNERFGSSTLAVGLQNFCQGIIFRGE
jgi:hypothetical protein